MLAPSTSSDPLKPNASAQVAGAGASAAANPKPATSQAVLNQIASSVGDVNETLGQVFEQFWGQPITVRLVSVTSQAMYFWRYDNFYVSQASSDIHLRMSDTGCSTLLTVALGEKGQEQPFSFSTLTGFEASLLTTFSREALTVLAKHFIQAKALTADKDKSSAETPMVHLVWAFSPTEDRHQALESGKLILSLPLHALKPDVLQAKEAPGYDMILTPWIYHALSPVEIAIGSGQLPISALEQLEADDIVLLEQSRIDQLFVMNPATKDRLPFSAKLLHPERLYNHPAGDTGNATQDMSSMSDAQGSRQALLDNLLIDVGAQFVPAKMPLHQIKQMSEGLVVEIGDLAHNEVLLTVDGKALALGELVVIGDKFGVRIVSLTPDGYTVPTRDMHAYPAPIPDAMREEAMTAQRQAPAAQAPQQEYQPQQQQQEYYAPQQQEQEQEQEQGVNDDFLDDDFGDDDDDDW